jgi:hypothetical protein
MSKRFRRAAVLAFTAAAAVAQPAPPAVPGPPPAPPRAAGAAPVARPLFTAEGPPAGWRVQSWENVANPPPPQARWRVQNGLLLGSDPRGTWLVSEREFGDFILEFEFRLGERGNSGVGLRVPAAGDPAFDALEIQLVDPRYHGADAAGIPPDQLTGSIYGALAPQRQVFRPGEWNTARIVARGPLLEVLINGVPVQNVNLDEQTAALPKGRPLAQRPRRGRIAFQELSRGGAQAAFRDVRLAAWD